MKYLLLALLGGLAVLAYRALGWCKVVHPHVNDWRDMVNAPDEAAMPPRRNRRVR